MYTYWQLTTTPVIYKLKLVGTLLLQGRLSKSVQIISPSVDLEPVDSLDKVLSQPIKGAAKRISACISLTHHLCPFGINWKVNVHHKILGSFFAAVTVWIYGAVNWQVGLDILSSTSNLFNYPCLFFIEKAQFLCLRIFKIFCSLMKILWDMISPSA